ncbi:MAG: rod shape-determining protein MreC [Thermodesulfobacteriota bacterium]
MFSKKTVLVVGIILFFAVNLIFLSLSIRHHDSSFGTEPYAISVAGPFQNIFSYLIGKIENVWYGYFFLVSAAEENQYLRRALGQAVEKAGRCDELLLSNRRLRRLLDFKDRIDNRVVAAEVIARDPSPWFKSIVINKGKAEGVKVSLPVVIPEGVVGIVTDVSAHYAKVLMLIDRNSAMDALVQRTRARGMIKGAADNLCTFEYVLRRHDVIVGDIIVSSGLDGVFPKGLRVGRVSNIVKQSSGIFQEITVTPFADFETLEEVLVILNPPTAEFAIQP